jgi:predicted nucleic acid-binding protein
MRRLTNRVWTIWRARLVTRYADLRLGETEASVAALADRLETDLVVTLDRRHFSVLRSPGGQPCRLLPDSGE